MYDNVCKFLAEVFSEDFSNWLIGKPVLMTELKAAELSLQQIRADSVIFNQNDINKILRSDIMRESVIYQEILAKGELKGEKKDETKASEHIALNLLQMVMNIEQIAQVTQLSV